MVADLGASITVPTGVTSGTYQEISAFLAEVERRAYKQAMFAVRESRRRSISSRMRCSS
jgi:hypothetical protein